MKVKIDRSGCIGCGLCAGTCPEVFRIGEDGLAEAYAQPSEEKESAVREAEENCPVSVIKTDE
jgi:ferredoxin